MAEDLKIKLLDSFPNSKLVGIIREYSMGQSGSPVFAACYKPKNDYGLNGTFIVKIGSESWARTEQNFYNKFFSDNALAPLLTRLHMPSNSLEGQMAVAYDVAFDSVIVPKPLMSILDDKNFSGEETQKQIENLSRALVNWYLNSKNSVVEDQHALIFRMLTAKRANDLLERLREALPFCNSDALQITVEGLKQQLPNPLTYMKKEILKKIQYNPHCPISRIHGDLHTGNVICSPPLQQTPKVIDFDQSVEDGVPFFDLAYLEFDIMRHLLSVEQRENRKHWLSLLDFSMAKIGGGKENPSWVTNGTWRFIRPIRQEVQRMVAVYGDDHEIVWWLSTVAVGLNFARKGDQTRSRFERMAAILYAAYGLDRILELFPLEELITEQPSFVPWIQGTGNLPLLSELAPSLPYQENLQESFPTGVNQPVPTEPPLEVKKADLPQTQSALPLEQGQLVASDSTVEPFDHTAIPSNGKESAPRTAGYAKEVQTDVGNNLEEKAKTIQKMLQNSLDSFNAGGLIYRDVCDSADLALQRLEDFLQELNQKIAQKHYQIRLPLENVVDLQKSLRANLRSFREVCPPLNTKKLSQSLYDEECATISKKLDELLAKFLALLKKFQ